VSLTALTPFSDQLVLIFVTVSRPGIHRINVRIRKSRMDASLKKSLSSFVSDSSIAEAQAPQFVRNLALKADLACRAACDSPDASPNFMFRYETLQRLQRYARRGKNDSGVAINQ
jgi:hypothetical protein